jgi:hypothetical protein
LFNIQDINDTMALAAETKQNKTKNALFLRDVLLAAF